MVDRVQFLQNVFVKVRRQVNIVDQVPIASLRIRGHSFPKHLVLLLKAFADDMCMGWSVRFWTFGERDALCDEASQGQEPRTKGSEHLCKFDLC